MGEQNNNFRTYSDTESDPVAQFYRDNHQYQTYEFAHQKALDYGALNRKRMSVWESIQALDDITDGSDPDTELSQLDHCLQTAEAIRAAGHPKWLQLTGLIHDLGKVLCLYGEPQWAVVGDTFPLGCAFSDQIIYADYFQHNPDYHTPKYQTALGIYNEHCGFDNLVMSFGHDEYLFRVLEQHLNPEALYVIRFHSFYSAHKEGAYQQFMSQKDVDMMPWLKVFQPFDLYSKGDDEPDKSAVLPYYENLVQEYLPGTLNW